MMTLPSSGDELKPKKNVLLSGGGVIWPNRTGRGNSRAGELYAGGTPKVLWTVYRTPWSCGKMRVKITLN
jgi:hypothetical protein